MEEAFARHGEHIREGNILKLRVCLSAQKIDIAIGFGLQKGNIETEWSGMQQAILNKIMPSKLKSGRFASLTNFVLLKADGGSSTSKKCVKTSTDS